MSLVPSPFQRLATATVSGLLSTVAQQIAGVKTFTSVLVASAGVQLASIFNTNGTGATDVVVKLGTNVADGSVNAGAKLLSVGTGINGTYVESLFVSKFGGLGSAGVLTIDQRSVTNAMGLVLINAGAGVSGIGFGDYQTRLGLSNAAELQLTGTNRAVGFYTNADAFTSAVTYGFIFRSDSIPAKDLVEFRHSAAQTGNFATFKTNAGVTQLTIDKNGSIAGSSGTGATDIATRLGTTVADGSVNASAKLLSIRTGIGGTEVEKASFNKAGDLTAGALNFARTLNDTATSFPTQLICNNQGGQTETAGTVADASTLWRFRNFGVDKVFVMGSGRIDQLGTDSSASAGPQIANKPTGKNAIAAGASSVVITNSLVTAASRVMITPHARDATCKELIAVPAAGSFTVSGTANATAALPFSWEVSNMF